MGRKSDLVTLRPGRRTWKEATEEHQAPEAAALSILSTEDDSSAPVGITGLSEETGEFGRREEGAWCCMGTSRPWFLSKLQVTLDTLLFFFEPQSSHPSTGGVDQSGDFCPSFFILCLDRGLCSTYIFKARIPPDWRASVTLRV